MKTIKAVEKINGVIVVYTNTGKNEIDIATRAEKFEENLSDYDKKIIRKAAEPMLEAHRIFVEFVAEKYGKSYIETEQLLRSRNIEDFRKAFNDEKTALKEFCWVQTILDPAGFTYEPHKDGIAVRAGSNGKILWIADENLKLHTTYRYGVDVMSGKEFLIKKEKITNKERK